MKIYTVHYKTKIFMLSKSIMNFISIVCNPLIIGPNIIIYLFLTYAFYSLPNYQIHFIVISLYSWFIQLLLKGNEGGGDIIGPNIFVFDIHLLFFT